MFWYDSPAAVKVMEETYLVRHTGADRRSRLRLIGRTDGH